MSRKEKYQPKSNEKINQNNYKELLKIEVGDEYEFLEDYKNSTTPISVKHKLCGNEYKVAPYEIIKRGSRCPKCAINEKSKKLLKDNNKLTNDLINIFGYMPYELLENYTSFNTKIKVKCLKCNSILEMTPATMLHPYNIDRPVCKTCAIQDQIKRNVKSEDTYKNEIKDHFKILEPYINEKIKILHKCLICGYEWKVKPGNIINNINKGKHCCPKCNNMARSNKSYDQKLLEKNPNIIALEEYTKSKEPILHKCLICGYEWKCIPSNRLKGEGCPECKRKAKTSKGEQELVKYIKSIYKDNIILQSRKILSSTYELDIYIPKLKLAIEYDGLFWHQEKFKGKKYHLNKTIECEKEGIRLIHIFEDEWYHQKILIQNKIKHLLQLDNNKIIIGARKCYVTEISKNNKDIFLNKNHIQGTDHTAFIRLGLWEKKEYEGDLGNLVAVMTFCKPRISLGNKNNSDNKKIRYELSRFATDINYRIPGAFSKLFSYFKNNYEFNEIITYADRRWSTGDVYLKCGFKFSHYSKPNYWYVHNNNGITKIHRYSFRKQLLESKFPEIYDPNLTEFQIMDQTCYFRIWDCGNIVFKYINH